MRLFHNILFFFFALLYVFPMMSSTTLGDTIPFEIGADKRIYVKTFVNNSPRPFRFLIDTGATDVVLNAAVPDISRLAIFSEEVINQGPTSTERIPCTPSTQCIKIGRTTQKDLKFLAISYPPHLWDGVIGLSFLTSYDVILNYDKKEMYLFPRGKAPKPNVPSINFTYKRGVPVIPVTAKINGDLHHLEVEIDSGSDRVLDINTPYVTKHKLRGSKPVFAISTISGTGTTSGNLENIHLDEVKIGTTVFPLLPGAFSTLTTGLQSTADFDGVVGNNLMMRFNQIWDFDHQELYLLVNNNFYNPFYDFLISK